MKFTVMFFAACLLMMNAFAQAATIPNKISYQGVLTNALGTPATDGSYDLKFELFDADTGGTMQWSETQSGVSVNRGSFGVLLGSSNPLPMIFDKPLYLEITAMAGPGISSPVLFSPRTQLASVPYALRGKVADSLVDGQAVKSLNSLKDNVRIVAGTNVAVAVAGDSVMITSTAGGGGTGIQTAQNTNSTLTITNPNGPIATINVKDSGITTLQLADNAVTTSKILNGTITGTDVSSSANLNIATLNTTGKVGIGTISSSATLNISDPDGFLLYLRNPSSNSIVDMLFETGGGPARFFQTAVGGTGGFIFYPEGRIPNSNINPTLAVITENVGIGTTSPLGRFHINNDVSGNDSAFVVLKSGAVGIGTTSPTYAFDKVVHLYGDNPAFKVETNDLAGWAYSIYKTPTQTWSLGVNDDDKLMIGTGDGLNTQKVTLQTDGNVGIGTASPLGKLHVNNDDSGSDSSFVISNSGNVGVGTSSPTGRFHVNNDASGSDSSFIVLNSGKVGIGTSTPLGKFHVSNDVSGSDSSFVVLNSGNVGIGTTSPQSLEHLYNANTSSTASQLTIEANSNYGSQTYSAIEFKANAASAAAGPSGRIVSYYPANVYTDATMTFQTIGPGPVFVNAMSLKGGNVAVGTTNPEARFEAQQSGATVAIFDRYASDGTVIAIQRDAATQGTISVAGTTVSYNAFTGSHYGWTEEAIETGTLVSFTGSNRRFHENEKSEIIYGISPSVRANDPACLGAYLGLQESSQPEGSENPHLVMAVGNGEMWVADNGKNIEAGDYLISSNVRGHAMKDDEERFPIGHVVARAAENVDWSSVTESMDGRKHKKISVLFGNFVRSSITNLTKEVQELRAMVKSLAEKQQSSSDKSLGELK